MSDEIAELAARLGIQPAQLAKMRVKLKSDEKLLAWLQVAAKQHRDRKWLLARHPSSFVEDENGVRHYGYTESPSEAMAENEEGVPPAEIANYRASRKARDDYRAEQMEEVGVLMAAMREVRAALDALPEDRKRTHSRSIWAYKGRMDALERDIRRRLAA